MNKAGGERIQRPDRLLQAGSLPQAGFTLIELIAVVIIIGLVLAVVFPRFSNLDETYLKTDASRLRTLITYLNEASETRKLYYRLSFDMERETIGVESSRDGRDYLPEADRALSGLRLGRGVDLVEVEVAGLGRVNTGKLGVVFAPFGPPQAFKLSLGSGKAAPVTVSFNPYSGRVRVESGHSVPGRAGGPGEVVGGGNQDGAL